MKTKLIGTLLAALISTCAFGQQINYRLGAVLGRGELYGVVGAELFPVFPKWKINAEGVTFTPLGGVFPESPVYAGAGLVRRWNQPEGHSYEFGVSVLTELGNGWSRLDGMKFGASAGVRF